MEDALLKGIETLPQPGSPGTINITSDGVAAIVKTNDGVIVAARELHKGRVVVLSHDGFLKKFRDRDPSHQFYQLHENIRRWLCHGNDPAGPQIQLIKKDTENIDAKTKVLVLTGTIASTKVSDESLHEYISNGGGFIHAVTPWGWSQLNGGKKIDDIPYNSFLQSIGFSYTGKVVHANKTGIHVGKGNVGCSDEKSNEDFNEILQDPYLYELAEIRTGILGSLTTVPVNGTPGTIICFGSQTFAVLGGSSPSDIIAGAANLGQGKVIAISHNGYAKKDSPLLKKILSWFSKSEDQQEYRVLDKKMTRSDIDKYSIIISCAEENQNISSDGIVDFVNKGGLFIHSMCPWGWLQLHPGKSLSQMPYHSVLEIAGMVYTDNYSSTKGSFCVSLTQEDSVEYAMKNICIALKYALRSDETIEKYSGCLSCVSSLPEHVKKYLQNESCNHLNRIFNKVQLPCKSRKLKKPHEKALAAFALEIHSDRCKEKCLSMVSEFPGCVPENYQVSEKTLTVTASISQCHPTGIYLPPNATLSVSVLNEEAIGKRWALQIGCHSDNIEHCNEWKRWPRITKRYDLVNKEFEVSSKFGGLLYLYNPGFKKEEKLEISLIGGTPAISFEKGNPKDLVSWNSRSDYCSPWTDLLGDFIQITVPSHCVQGIEDPSDILEAWDSVILAHHTLRQTQPCRREWIVCDVQISAGYMHAGYPIMAHLDITEPSSDHFILNIDTIKNGKGWGLYHELGHNMQRPWWTFEGTGEVTCNIFSLHAMDTVSGVEPWIHPWLQNSLKKIEQTLNGKDIYKAWKANPGVALGIYAQLQHYFGWESYKKVFKAYEEIPAKHKPQANQDKIDKWIELFSTTVNRNLCPLFAFWDIPFTESLISRVSELELFIPDDQMTQYAPDRMSDIKAIYA